MDLYSSGRHFESRLVYLIFLARFIEVFFSLFRVVPWFEFSSVFPKLYLEMEYDHLLPNPYLFS